MGVGGLVQSPFVVFNDRALTDLNSLLIVGASPADGIIHILCIDSVWQRSESAIAKQKVDFFQRLARSFLEEEPDSWDGHHDIERCKDEVVFLFAMSV